MIAEDQVRSRKQSALNISKTLQIAIDGPAGAGKSTVAKRVSDLLGYLYIDTGAMYRAATWSIVNRNIDVTDAAAIAKAISEVTIELKPGTVKEKVHVFVDRVEVTSDIRSEQITRLVSKVATIASVREQLVKQQQKMANVGGVVLDGRDIGTVVLPNANIKIFLTASAEVRAQRRFDELKAKGLEPDYVSLLADIVERDHRDTNRTIAPLQMAEDAVLILSDNMSIDDVVSHIIKLCE